MKNLNICLLLFVFILPVSSCRGTDEGTKTNTNSPATGIKVVYFHMTHRCATCMAVENVSRSFINNEYASMIEEGTLAYEVYNIEDEEGKQVASSYNISGQALIIVNGDEIINLTNQGFLNARTNPDKFRDILKGEIDKLL